MNVKNALHLFTLFLLSAFTLSSCSDECERQVENIKDLNKYVPYTGTETLRFLHNSTDTQIFVGQGMERFFVSTSDEGCVTDHESVRIRFKNTQSSDEIKMEYVFDEMLFSNGFYLENNSIDFKFHYKAINVSASPLGTSAKYVNINGVAYNYVAFYSSNDTLEYIAYRPPFDGNYGGILKIKYPNDTLTLIR